MCANLSPCWLRRSAPDDPGDVGRGLADGTVEVRDRKSDVREEIAVDEAAAHIAGIVRG